MTKRRKPPSAASVAAWGRAFEAAAKTSTAAPPITEKEFMAQVVQLAKLRGWLCYHTYDARNSAAGFPDLVLVRRERLIFAELKRNGGKPTPEQLQWLAALRAVATVTPAVHVRLWRPMDWADMEAMLA